MGESEEFNTLTFEKKLMQLKDTQESIQGLSSWCLKQRAHHKKIVSSWLNVLKRVKVEQRLVLFYLANDVIQYSKRKNYEFVESWGLNLQKATPLVREEKVRQKILRIFKIWEQRSVYDDEFLSDLTGLLSAGAIKKTDDEALDFQPQQLVNKIKQCSVLEADTDLRLKYIHESHLELSDADALCANLKERSNKDDVEKELNEGIGCVERYTAALQREILAREALLTLLTSANQYYSTQRGEVKVVAYAYKNFGARVRALKRKLDELIPTLPTAAPSPPRRDEDVPSPGPDEDLELPNAGDQGDDEVSYNIDKTFNTSLSADGSLYNLGLSSFLNSDNTLAIFGETSPANNVVSGALSQKSQDALPGLDLLTPESTGNPPPPTSFYGSLENHIDDPEPYRPEITTQWNSNSWSLPPVGVPPPVPVPAPAPVVVPVGLAGLPGGGAPGPVPAPPPPPRTFMEAPESPPHAPVIIPENSLYSRIQDIPPSDVDHRGILPPPPPPPVLPILGHMEDVDHRLLPTLPPPVPPVTSSNRHGAQDVDHRNLISLTHQPALRPAAPRQMSLDQDYRVPPMVPPSDIVESVDMDLSEDEDQPGMYPNQPPSQNDHRRHSFNNNKVLVGGDNGKIHDQKNANLIRINNTNFDKEKAHTAPVLPPMMNPFDNMPSDLKSFNMPFQSYPPKFPPDNEDRPEFDEEIYDEDLRNRPLENSRDIRNPSPPDYENDGDWNSGPQRPFVNQRFPRNWGPRNSMRPGFGPQQFWPRNGPRTPNRWMGPRPQRFW